MTFPTGSEPVDLSRPPRTDWDRPPWNRWSFQHVGEILPTVEVSRGSGPVRPLSRRERPLDDLQVAGTDGRAATLLQSSNVAYKYGVSGPFWYASGA